MANSPRNALAEFDEPEIVRRLVAGDAEELRKFYLKAFPVMSARVSRLFGGGLFDPEEVEEIANDALVKAHRKITTDFDAGREGKLSALVFTIVVNEAKDRLRWRKASNRDPLDRPGTSLLDDPENVEGSVGDSTIPANVIPAVEGRMPDDKLKRLQEAAKRIPKGERSAVVRRIFANELTELQRNVLSWRLVSSDSEIAKELETSEGNVRKIRSGALKKWVEAMERWAGPDER